MEENKIMTHLTKGILVSLILIVIGVVAHFAGIENQSWYRWLPLVMLLAAIIWGCVYYSNQMNNQVTFGNVFTHGFKMSAVIAVILVIWTLLEILVIFPEIKEKALDQARQKMEDGGKMTDSDIDRAIDVTRRFFLAFAIGGAILGTLIVGAVASLIGAGVAKKKPVNPLDQMNM